MKKAILSLSFLFVFALAYSQDYSFRFGAKAGLNYSDLKSGGGYDYSLYHGYTVGAFTEMRKASLKDFFLRGGVNFSQRGVTYSKEETVNKYLEVPIQLGYKYKATSFLNIYALAGPSVQFRMYGNAYMKGFSDHEIETQKFIAAGEANIGFEFLKHIQLEGGYQYGFTPDYKSSSFSGNNSTFNLTVGLAF
ncbi:MAG: hypothetical protein H6Q14_2153 [Bacteroidetes bacterium]|jgi:hypothetical protein|nr:hypothetical protein [Bacteroidota bacterium]